MAGLRILLILYEVIVHGILTMYQNLSPSLLFCKFTLFMEDFGPDTYYGTTNWTLHLIYLWVKLLLYRALVALGIKLENNSTWRVFLQFEKYSLNFPIKASLVILIAQLFTCVTHALSYITNSNIQLSWDPTTLDNIIVSIKSLDLSFLVF